MHEDDVDNDYTQDETSSQEVPALTAEEIADLQDTDRREAGREIVIEERTISSLSEIIAFAKEYKRPISFGECVLNQVRIDSADVDISVDECVFAEQVDFRKGIFGGKLSFWDAAFRKRAYFGLSVFKEKVSFEECTFYNSVNFAGATFENGAAFASCVFEGEITFDHAKFAGEVDFSESIFSKKVTFKNTRFSQVVDLSDVEFKQGSDTTGSNLMKMEKAVRAKQTRPQKRLLKRAKPRPEFSPWRKLDQLSKKNISRRQVLRGIFRFLPEKDEK